MPPLNRGGEDCRCAAVITTLRGFDNVDSLIILLLALVFVLVLLLCSGEAARTGIEGGGALIGMEGLLPLRRGEGTTRFSSEGGTTSLFVGEEFEERIVFLSLLLPEEVAVIAA